jgi:cystathionine beta-lyase
MQYDFDQLIDRRASDSAKWNYFPEGVLPLWVADMDFVSPEPVVQALRARVEHGVFGYAMEGHNFPGEKGLLREVIVERMRRLYGWEIKSEDILFTPGVVVGFNQASHALGAPGGGVLIQTPVYPPFLGTAEAAGMQLQTMQLSRQADGQYEIDFAAFEAAFTPETRLFTLCNPHNPVGRVYRRDELEKMAEICLKHGVAICSDEIHCDLLYRGQRHIPIASLDPEVAQNSITLLAPSKTFNVAGLGCSYAIIQNPELRKKYAQAGQGLVHGVNLLGMTAAMAAYQGGGEWLEQVLAYLEGNRDYLAAYVREALPGVKMALPEGTYLAWLDCREAGLADSPYKFFLERARVGLNDGATFGPGGEGFVRLNFGCPRPVLTAALERMKVSMNVEGQPA